MRHRNQDKDCCCICGEYDYKENMILMAPAKYAHSKCEENKIQRGESYDRGKERKRM